ncbi:hypothetical protein [Jhaorihella thermophila]|nr:hypothetical protein [Jhaorihella thermophila]
MELYEAKKIKGTDQSITLAMEDIVDNAAAYLKKELPDPEEDLAIKLWKEKKGIKPKTKGSVTRPDEVAARTLRNWVRLYKKGGKTALVDKCANQGNRNSYFTAEEMKLLAEVVRDEYLTLQRKPVSAVVLDVKRVFRREKISAVKLQARQNCGSRGAKPCAFSSSASTNSACWSPDTANRKP